MHTEVFIASCFFVPPCKKAFVSIRQKDVHAIFFRRRFNRLPLAHSITRSATTTIPTIPTATAIPRTTAPAVRL